VSACADASRVARLVAKRLPWGFQKTAPPSFASLESTPTDVAASFGPLPPGTVRVPPSWSLTTSTVSSSRALAGLLHPAPDHGVHRVSTRAVLRARSCLRRQSRSRASSPMLLPLRAFPTRAAVPASPLTVAPSSFLRLPAAATSRPCSTRASVAVACVATCTSPLLSGLPFLKPRADCLV
jgi:hypothetical protein